MDTLKINIDDSELRELVRQYPDVSARVRRAKVTDALALLEREVKKGTPYGAGPIHLRDNIQPDIQTQGSKVYGTIGTPLEHGIPVEMGTRPHFPPIEPIRFWVEKKLGITDPKEARSVAYLVARAISRRGTEGREMFGKAFEENEYKLNAILSEIPAEIVRRVGR